MSHAPELQLIAHALARARMPGHRAGRPARQIAMGARHLYARQLGNR
jgi:hypothetical protein